MSRVEEIKTRAMLEVAVAPISLIPFLLGGTILVGMFALKIASIAGLVVGIAGLAWGIGSSFYRFRYSQAVYQRVDQTLAQEQERKRKQEIATLRSALNEEGVSLLDDILGLTDLLQSFTSESVASAELIAMAKSLLEQSLANLSKIPVLDKTVSVTSGRKTKDLIKQQRANIFTETKANVENVAKVISSMHGSAGARVFNDQEAARQQLGERLESTKAIEQQFAALGLSSLSVGQVPVSQ